MNGVPREKILIVLVAGLGDLVMASKGIRSIRNGYPEAEIHILTSADTAPLARSYRYFDRVWAFPIRQFKQDKRYLQEILRLIRVLRTIRFRQVLNLYPVTSRTGALRMGLLFLTLRADDRIGHGRHGFELFLTHKLPGELFQGRHVVDAMQEIALAAGGVPDECGIEIVWNKAVELRWRELFSDNGNGPLTIGLNPGGARENRRWNPDGYAILANRLVAEHGARIILLGAPSEVALAGYIASTIPKQSIVNLTGRLNLDELAYIISRLNLLVTNDSGPMHIGAAAGTPLVALFGPGNPVSYLPYTAPERFRILCRDIDCRPCDRDHCARPVCLESILPDEVYEECRKLMGGSPCDGTGNARTAVQGKSE